MLGLVDYIHLNPVRAGWVGGDTAKTLRSWRWSSFPSYAGGKVPGWLDTGRVLRAFQLSEDRRGGKAYGGYLEARAKDPKSAINDAALGELRRGWVLGEKGFVETVLAALGGQQLAEKKEKGSVGGEAVKAHDEAEAERIAKVSLALLGLPDEVEKLAGRGKWLEEKAVIAAVIRQRTGVGNRWIARRLAMGQESSVVRAVRRAKENATEVKRRQDLEIQLAAYYRD